MRVPPFFMFKDYNIEIHHWLRQAFEMDHMKRVSANIVLMTRNGTTDGGRRQHEIHIDSNDYEYRGRTFPIFRNKMAIKVENATNSQNNAYFMVNRVVDNVLILDENYEKIKFEQPEPSGRVQQITNVIYGDLELAYANIRQPILDGVVPYPGVSFYISDYQQKLEKSRPYENYYTRRYKDNNTGIIKGVNKVPPLQEFQVHYMVNFFCRTRQELDYMQYQIIKEFRPQKWLWMPGPTSNREDGRGKEHEGQWAHMLLDVVQDVSDVEPGATPQDRVLRFEVGFMVTNAFIPLAFDEDQPFIEGLQIETETRKQKPF